MAKKASDAVKKKARQEFAEWVLRVMLDNGGGSCPELVQQGMLHFSRDADWSYRIMNEELYTLLYRITQDMISVGRRLGGVKIVDPETGKKEVDGWDRCIVFERPVDVYIALGEMTKQDLLRAAYNREKRALAEKARADALRRLAEMLPDETTRLREVCDYRTAMAILGGTEATQKAGVLAQV